MASEKKPSSQTDRGKVRSSEELETYGVWVKSEPQDMASQQSGDGFVGEAVPFEGVFDMGFDGAEASEANFGSFDEEGFDSGSFMPGPFQHADFEESPADLAEPGPGFASESESVPPDSGLLLRIAEEISSLRSEIKTLKEEFADIRGEGVETPPEPDVFRDEIDITSGSNRDVDEAALRELSRRNEAEAGKRPDETLDAKPDWVFDGDEIADSSADESPFVDFPPESDSAERELLLNADLAADTLETDIAFLAGDSREDVVEGSDIFSAFSGELPSSETVGGMNGFEGMRIDEKDALSGLPDSGEGLDGDPFALPGAESWDFQRDSDVFGIGVDAGTDSLDGASPLDDGGETSALSDDFSTMTESAGLESWPPLDDGASLYGEDEEVPAFAGDFSSMSEPSALDDGLSLDSDFSTNVASDDIASTDVADPLDEANILSGDGQSASEGIILDYGSDADGAPSPGGNPFDDVAGEDDVPFIDEDMIISSDWLSGEDEPTRDEPDGGVNLPAWLLSESELDGVPGEPHSDYGSAMDKASSRDDASDGADSIHSDLQEGELSGENNFTAAPLEFPDIPLDEPPTVGEAALDASRVARIPDDPVLDDISLDLGGFEMDDPSIDDSPLVREIPEGFEVDAEEAVSELDEDIGIASDSRKRDATAAGKADDAAPDLSPGLRKDLKGVLSYMDSLLESLPDDKIEEFAKSKHFDTYRKLFKELGLLR